MEPGELGEGRHGCTVFAAMLTPVVTGKGRGSHCDGYCFSWGLHVILNYYKWLTILQIHILSNRAVISPT